MWFRLCRQNERFDGLDFIYFIIIPRESYECEFPLVNYGLFLNAQIYRVRFLNGRVSCIETYGDCHKRGLNALKPSVLYGSL